MELLHARAVPNFKRKPCEYCCTKYFGKGLSIPTYSMPSIFPVFCCFL